MPKNMLADNRDQSAGMARRGWGTMAGLWQGPGMDTLISVEGVGKRYADGKVALRDVHLQIARGEILALLGPNGAGKTTLISIICGLVRASGGRVVVDGHDIVRDYKAARRLIGLVPQELTTDTFESVWTTVSFSRGLFGKAPDPGHIERVLRSLSLWDKRHSRILALSGGMKRRVLIAKALAHEPRILFLDEPTAGVDVELRRDMWAMIDQLREQGNTVILTTHYIEEAEELADRIGIIDQGRLTRVQDKAGLMAQMGQKRLVLELAEHLPRLPQALAGHALTLSADGARLTYTYDRQGERTGITALLGELHNAGVRFRDLHTEQSSLEDIFVDLLNKPS